MVFPSPFTDFRKDKTSGQESSNKWVKLNGKALFLKFFKNVPNPLFDLLDEKQSRGYFPGTFANGQFSSVSIAISCLTRCRVICIKQNLLNGSILCLVLSEAITSFILSKTFWRFSLPCISIKSITIIPPCREAAIVVRSLRRRPDLPPMRWFPDLLSWNDFRY